MTAGWIDQANRVAVSAGCAATDIVAERAKKISTANQERRGQPTGVDRRTPAGGEGFSGPGARPRREASNVRKADPAATMPRDANQAISETLPAENAARCRSEPAIAS